MVVQLTRRSHDGTEALFPHLDQKPARLRAADRPAVHAVSLFRPSWLLIDALEHYAFPTTTTPVVRFLPYDLSTTLPHLNNRSDSDISPASALAVG
ncbi:hypothetical protein GCM10023080_005610 [Streptomyces pseudoechinosporeus]